MDTILTFLEKYGGALLGLAGFGLALFTFCNARRGVDLADKNAKEALKLAKENAAAALKMADDNAALARKVTEETAALGRKVTEENSALALKLSHAKTELDIDNKIAMSRSRLSDYTVTHQVMLCKSPAQRDAFSEEEKITHQVVTKGHKVAIEEFLNALDAACHLYLEDRIDRERFRKSYEHRICDAVDEHPDYFKLNTRFNGIEECYREWRKVEVKK